jgi:hypothetical protein
MNVAFKAASLYSLLQAGGHLLPALTVATYEHCNTADIKLVSLHLDYSCTPTHRIAAAAAAASLKTGFFGRD